MVNLQSCICEQPFIHIYIAPNLNDPIPLSNQGIPFSAHKPYLLATLAATVFSSELIQWQADINTNSGVQKLHYLVASQFWVYSM